MDFSSTILLNALVAVFVYSFLTSSWTFGSLMLVFVSNSFVMYADWAPSTLRTSMLSSYSLASKW